MSITPDITLYVGIGAIIRVAVVDSVGAVKDLASAEIIFRIGDIRGGTTKLNKAGELVNDGTDGLIQVELTAVDTATLSVRTYDYQIIATDASDNQRVVKEGTVLVKYTLETI